MYDLASTFSTVSCSRLRFCDIIAPCSSLRQNIHDTCVELYILNVYIKIIYVKHYLNVVAENFQR